MRRRQYEWEKAVEEGGEYLRDEAGHDGGEAVGCEEQMQSVEGFASREGGDEEMKFASTAN